MGAYRLEQHDFRFHKIGRDGSGNCDAFYTGHPADNILDVLYEIAAAGKIVLDKAEDLGIGHGEKSIRVIDENYRVETCSSYYALLIEASLMPCHWYKEHVLIGARRSRIAYRVHWENLSHRDVKCPGSGAVKCTAVHP